MDCRLVDYLKKALLLVVAMVATAAGSVDAFAAASCPTFQLQQKPYYHLEFTVSSTYCKSNPHNVGCQSYDSRFPVQLHGLWVDYELNPDLTPATANNPQYPGGTCDEPGCGQLDHPPQPGNYCQILPDVPALHQTSTWTSSSNYFSDKAGCLERHEWVKHGTCTPMDQALWIDWSLSNATSIIAALGLPADTDISPVQVDATIAAKLPTLVGGFHFACVKDSHGVDLSTFSIDYAWGNQPGQPIIASDRQNTYKGCGNAFRVPSKP